MGPSCEVRPVRLLEEVPARQDGHVAERAAQRPAPAPLPAMIQRLQASAGNRAVARLIDGGCQCGGGGGECHCGGQCQCQGECACGGEGAAHHHDHGPPEQTIATLARKSEFAIEGRPEDSKSHTSLIFFDLDSAELAGDEPGKIAALATPPDRELTLRGTASEEGPAGHNTELVKHRIGNVSKALGDAGHTAGRTPKVEPAGGSGSIDYRRARSVEVILEGKKASQEDCSLGPQPNDCGAAPNGFTKGLARAKEMIKLTSDALKKSPPDAPVATALKNLFGGPTHTFDPATLPTIQANLGKIAGQLDNMEPFGGTSGHRCVNLCDSACGGGATAYNTGTGPSALMTLCPVFMSEPDADEQAATLIHEGSHGTAGLETDDRAYRWQRLVTRLPTSGSLANADSYSGLVQLCVNPGSVQLGPSEEDKAGAGMTDAAEVDAGRTAIAWLEQWLIGTQSQVSSLYGVAHESIGTGSWTNDFYKARMAFLAPEFGLASAPPAVPSEKDKEAIAGIADRYQKLFDVTQQPITMEKSADAATTWAPGPGSTVFLGTGFFGLGAKEQVDAMLEALIAQLPTIPAARRKAYVDVLHDVVTSASLGSP
jgi:hypothetical protein